MIDYRNKYGRCPYCNKKIGKYTEQYAEKHIRKCKLRIHPYIYSDRNAGRPTKKETMEFLRQHGRI